MGEGFLTGSWMSQRQPQHWKPTPVWVTARESWNPGADSTACRQLGQPPSTTVVLTAYVTGGGGTLWQRLSEPSPVSLWNSQTLIFPLFQRRRNCHTIISRAKCTQRRTAAELIQNMGFLHEKGRHTPHTSRPDQPFFFFFFIPGYVGIHLNRNYLNLIITRIV